MPNDRRLDTPADLPAEFKEWLKRYTEQELGVLGSNVSSPHLAVNESYPWLVDVDVFQTAIAQTNWDTNTLVASTIYGATKDSTGAQSAQIGFDVVLAAGTWTFELMHRRSTDRGIYTVALAGNDIGTIDGYVLATASNVRSTITGVNVREPVKQRLTLTMKTQNGSSSSFVGSIQHIQFRRTA